MKRILLNAQKSYHMLEMFQNASENKNMFQTIKNFEKLKLKLKLEAGIVVIRYSVEHAKRHT